MATTGRDKRCRKKSAGPSGLCGTHLSARSRAEDKARKEALEENGTLLISTRKVALLVAERYQCSLGTATTWLRTGRITFPVALVTPSGQDKYHWPTVVAKLDRLLGKKTSAPRRARKHTEAADAEVDRVRVDDIEGLNELIAKAVGEAKSDPD